MKFSRSSVLLVLALLVGFWGGMKYQSGRQEGPVPRPSPGAWPEGPSASVPAPAASPEPQVIERPRPAPPALPAGTPPFTRLPSVDPEAPVFVQLQKEEIAASLRRDGIPEEDIQHMLAGSRKKDQVELDYLSAAPALSPEDMKEKLRASLEAEGLPSQDIETMLKGDGKGKPPY